MVSDLLNSRYLAIFLLKMKYFTSINQNFERYFFLFIVTMLNSFFSEYQSVVSYDFPATLI